MATGYRRPGTIRASGRSRRGDAKSRERRGAGCFAFKAKTFVCGKKGGGRPATVNKTGGFQNKNCPKQKIKERGQKIKMNDVRARKDCQQLMRQPAAFAGTSCAEAGARSNLPDLFCKRAE